MTSEVIGHQTRGNTMNDTPRRVNAVGRPIRNEEDAGVTPPTSGTGVPITQEYVNRAIRRLVVAAIGVAIAIITIVGINHVADVERQHGDDTHRLEQCRQEILNSPFGHPYTPDCDK
jgi:hypothetical protein